MTIEEIERDVNLAITHQEQIEYAAKFAQAELKDILQKVKKL